MATRKRKAPTGEASMEVATHVAAPHDALLPDRMPAGVPVIYADQITDIIYGIHTSKLVLGLENGRGPARPVAMVVVPTAALVVASGNFLDTMSNEGMIAETAERLTGIVEMLRRLRNITPRKP